MSQKMDGHTYTCEHCRGVFTAEWSEEDANREAQELWGVEGASAHPGMAEICDDCFKAFMAWLPHDDSSRC